MIRAVICEGGGGEQRVWSYTHVEQLCVRAAIPIVCALRRDGERISSICQELRVACDESRMGDAKSHIEAAGQVMVIAVYNLAFC